MIPNIKECLYLMDQYQMLQNIKAHSLVVARVAHLIARSLDDAGCMISIEKVTAGALMHDIGKTSSLESGRDHSEIGRQICLENSLDEIADIVGEHVRLKAYDLNDGFSEKEIVFYSDKRVNHDRIVSLEERLAYILERYRGRHVPPVFFLSDKFECRLKLVKKPFCRLKFTSGRWGVPAPGVDIW